MKRAGKYFRAGAFILLLVICMTPGSVMAAKYREQWVLKKGFYRYYNAKGKAVTGVYKIKKKTYYFDEKGRQLTGWQKANNNYFYFANKNGKKGYLIKSRTVNGIKLKKNGRAVKTSGNADRLYALTEAARIVRAVSRPSDEKSVKLKKTWDYFQKNYLYRGELTFRNGSDWEADYARNVFLTKRGNCYGLGAAWAFLASACGYSKSYAVSSGGHGWAEINGRVFDPSWARTDLKNNYYNMDMDLSGRNGRPNYKKYRYYIEKV